MVRALAQESDWVKNHEHIFVVGPTGVGKSYVASALAQKACRDGYSVYYTRTAALSETPRPQANPVYDAENDASMVLFFEINT